MQTVPPEGAGIVPNQKFLPSFCLFISLYAFPYLGLLGATFLTTTLIENHVSTSVVQFLNLSNFGCIFYNIPFFFLNSCFCHCLSFLSCCLCYLLFYVMLAMFQQTTKKSTKEQETKKERKEDNKERKEREREANKKQSKKEIHKRKG